MRIVDVDSVHNFKFRLDEVWLEQPIMCHWKADFGESSESVLKACDACADMGELERTLPIRKTPTFHLNQQPIIQLWHYNGLNSLKVFIKAFG